MQFLLALLIICCFNSYSYHSYQLLGFCLAQYDRIGNTYEQIRNAGFYKKPGKYPERIGSYGEEQDKGKESCTTQSTNNHGLSNEKKNQQQ
ncbi:NEDD8-activating enzyme E1 regulatory subunit [Dirofilaria immitis]